MGNGNTTYCASPELDCGTVTGNVVATRITSAIFTRPDAPTERAQRIWSAGDYDRIAAGFRHEGEAFVDRIGLRVSDRVLDAASGSGNLTIPAARTGASVTALDLVPSLIDAAAEWSNREGLSVHFDQGTVEELPYQDRVFDVVMSMFGVMFAPRPDRVVRELERVTKIGGRVVLANWIRDGFIGRMLAMHAAYVPPPAGASSPLLWGDDATIHEWFDPSKWDVTTSRRTLTFRYPQTPAGTAELFRAFYGPTVRTFEALDENRRAFLAGDLADLWARGQTPGAHGTQVDSEYLQVEAVRR